MSAIIANFMQLLPYNFKSTMLISGFLPGYIFLPNEMVQTRLANRLPKRFQFVFGSFRDQLHPAAGQIADQACYFKAGGDRFHGVTEPDALHLTRVKDLYSPANQSIHRCQCATISRFREENRLAASSDNRDKAIMLAPGATLFRAPFRF